MPRLATVTPKFAIVGTNRADNITGTNIADRIIGLGGNDKLDGGRGNDCIEGRTGGDNISGALGNDRLYGSSGKDHLNGGPGTDYMNAGGGDDTINAAFGKDRAIGGAGRDFINIATAGPAASADCGSGNDVARINNNERGRVKELRADRRLHRKREVAPSADARNAGGAGYSPAREPSRSDQDVRRGAGSVPRRGTHRDLRDDRTGRLPASHATLVRDARSRALGMDVREVPEGAQSRA